MMEDGMFNRISRGQAVENRKSRTSGKPKRSAEIKKREGTKMKTIRVYTRTVSMHTPEGWIKFSVRGSDEADMLELGYVDYDENGNVRGIGTEDFSLERFRTLKTYYYQIKKDSGEKTAAGKTKWDLVKTAVIRIAKADYAKGAKLWKKQYRDNGMIVV